MGFIKEFRDFAVRGNVIDLAVGVIIGGAFGKIVTSVIDDMIMPLVGRVLGNADFTNWYIGLTDAVRAAEEAAASAGGALPLEEAKKIGPVFAYGHFLTIMFDFLILAFIIFLMVKGMNNLKRKEAAAPAPPPVPSKEELLLTEIRDILKDRK